MSKVHFTSFPCEVNQFWDMVFVIFIVYCFFEIFERRKFRFFLIIFQHVWKNGFPPVQRIDSRLIDFLKWFPHMDFEQTYVFSFRWNFQNCIPLVHRNFLTKDLILKIIIQVSYVSGHWGEKYSVIRKNSSGKGGKICLFAVQKKNFKKKWETKTPDFFLRLNEKFFGRSLENFRQCRQHCIYLSTGGTFYGAGYLFEKNVLGSVRSLDFD